jgi:transcriptional regulator with PAS, ATPase and Fis domain
MAKLSFFRRLKTAFFPAKPESDNRPCEAISNPVITITAKRTNYIVSAADVGDAKRINYIVSTTDGREFDLETLSNTLGAHDSVRAAARSLGVAESTLRYWKKNYSL